MFVYGWSVLELYFGLLIFFYPMGPSFLGVEGDSMNMEKFELYRCIALSNL